MYIKNKNSLFMKCSIVILVFYQSDDVEFQTGQCVNMLFWAVQRSAIIHCISVNILLLQSTHVGMTFDSIQCINCQYILQQYHYYNHTKYWNINKHHLIDAPRTPWLCHVFPLAVSCAAEVSAGDFCSHSPIRSYAGDNKPCLSGGTSSNGMFNHKYCKTGMLVANLHSCFLVMMMALFGNLRLRLLSVSRIRAAFLLSLKMLCSYVVCGMKIPETHPWRKSAYLLSGGDRDITHQLRIFVDENWCVQVSMVCFTCTPRL